MHDLMTTSTTVPPPRIFPVDGCRRIRWPPRSRCWLRWRTLLPAGEAKEMTIKLCSTCHDLERTMVSRKTQEEWESTVYDMIGRGAQIFPDEAEQIIQYLSAHFKPCSLQTVRTRVAPLVLRRFVDIA